MNQNLISSRQMKLGFTKTKADLIDQENIDGLNEILVVKTADRSPMIEIEIFLQLVRRDRRLRLKRDPRQREQPQRPAHTNLQTHINDVNPNHQVAEVRPLMTPIEPDLLPKTEAVHKIGTEIGLAQIRDISRHRILDTNPNQTQDHTLDQGLQKIQIVS